METSPKQSPRLDHWLKKKYPTLTQRQIQEALERNLVVNERGKPLKKGLRLDTLPPNIDFGGLDLHINKLKSGRQIDIEVIYEDEEIVVIDKPAGLPSHPISLFDEWTVTGWARNKYPLLNESFDTIQPTFAVHRLDTETSGLLILSKNKESFEDWRQKFSNHEVKKEYFAWCWGKPYSTNFENQSPIGHLPNDPRRMTSLNSSKSPIQKASSQFEVIQQSSQSYFLCKVLCTTGATHQVRVHLSDLGFPLLGDRLYDPLYESRPVTPKYHQLRATGISVGELKFALPPPSNLPF